MPPKKGSARPKSKARRGRESASTPPRLPHPTRGQRGVRGQGRSSAGVLYTITPRHARKVTQEGSAQTARVWRPGRTPGTGRYFIPAHSREEEYPRVNLTHDQEDDVMAWYPDNFSLWELRHPNYMKTRIRDQKFHDKAKELGVEGLTGPRLKTVIDSWRTRYGKITKAPPSSSGSIRLSERDRWIKAMFDPILEARMYRKRAKPAGKEDLIQKLESRFPERFQRQQETQQETQQEGQEEEEDTTRPSTPLEEHTPRVQPKSRSKTQEANGDNTQKVLEKLKGILEHQGTLQQQLPLMSGSSCPNSRERRAYAQWFEACLASIHPTLYRDFQTNIHHVVDKFKTRSRLLYRQESRQQMEQTPLQQPPQQAPPPMQFVPPMTEEFQAAWLLGMLQQKQCPSGTLPQWQAQYQSQTLPPLPPRPRSAPQPGPSSALGAPPGLASGWDPIPPTQVTRVTTAADLPVTIASTPRPPDQGTSAGDLSSFSLPRELDHISTYQYIAQ